ncbi:MAG: alcohol dehydrogenase catalytic domain-containing protein, partial [Acidobacteriia bacterium]|nr:alcohol dehydrogenase catalytic domain-containing protein [Terriglobia bacterium]
MKAIWIEQHGAADVLKFGDFPKPEPGPGQALVKIAAAGVNFIDTYQRSGLYKIPLPAVLGSEGAGVVEAVGEGVKSVTPGDRVAWGTARGAYAEYAAVPESALVRIPENLDFKQAA